MTYDTQKEGIIRVSIEGRPVSVQLTDCRWKSSSRNTPGHGHWKRYDARIDFVGTTPSRSKPTRPWHCLRAVLLSCAGVLSQSLENDKQQPYASPAGARLDISALVIALMLCCRSCYERELRCRSAGTADIGPQGSAGTAAAPSELGMPTLCLLTPVLQLLQVAGP